MDLVKLGVSKDSRKAMEVLKKKMYDMHSNE